MQLFDWDTGRVYVAAAVATGLTIAQVNAILTTVVLIGTAIYTWRKALKKKIDRDED